MLERSKVFVVPLRCHIFINITRLVNLVHVRATKNIILLTYCFLKDRVESLLSLKCKLREMFRTYRSRYVLFRFIRSSVSVSQGEDFLNL